MNKFYWKLARAKTINYTIPFFFAARTFTHKTFANAPKCPAIHWLLFNVFKQFSCIIITTTKTMQILMVWTMNLANGQQAIVLKLHWFCWILSLCVGVWVCVCVLGIRRTATTISGISKCKRACTHIHTRLLHSSREIKSDLDTVSLCLCRHGVFDYYISHWLVSSSFVLLNLFSFCEHIPPMTSRSNDSANWYCFEHIGNSFSDCVRFDCVVC